MVDVVLLILDRKLRESLAAALHGQTQLRVACSTSETDCIDAALRACDAPVLVLDAQLVGAWTSRPAPKNGRAPRVILCADDIDSPTVQAGIEHGVHGCLPRAADPIAWRDAILAVASGDYWIPRRLMAAALMRLAGTATRDDTLTHVDDGLTARQRDIVRCVAQGLSNKAIAQRLHISPTTVKTHLQNIFERCGVHGRQQLALQAMRTASGPASYSDEPPTRVARAQA